MLTISYENATYKLYVNQELFLTFGSFISKDNAKIDISINLHILNKYEPELFYKMFFDKFRFIVSKEELPFYQIFSPLLQTPFPKVSLDIRTNNFNSLKLKNFFPYTYLLFTDDINLIDPVFSSAVVENVMRVKKLHLNYYYNNKLLLQKLFENYKKNNEINQYVNSFFQILSDYKIDMWYYKHLGPSFLVKYLESVFAYKPFLIYPLIIQILFKEPLTENIFYTANNFSFPVHYKSSIYLSSNNKTDDQLTSYFVPFSFVEYLHPELNLNVLVKQSFDSLNQHFKSFGKIFSYLEQSYNLWSYNSFKHLYET